MVDWNGRITLVEEITNTTNTTDRVFRVSVETEMTQQERMRKEVANAINLWSITDLASIARRGNERSWGDARKAIQKLTTELLEGKIQDSRIVLKNNFFSLEDGLKLLLDVREYYNNECNADMFDRHSAFDWGMDFKKRGEIGKDMMKRVEPVLERIYAAYIENIAGKEYGIIAVSAHKDSELGRRVPFALWKKYGHPIAVLEKDIQWGVDSKQLANQTKFVGIILRR
jgi:hypothetical protein